MKKMISAILALLMSLLNLQTICAESISFNNNDMNGSVIRRTDGYAYTYEVKETVITGWSDYKTCFGQPAGGTVYNSTNSGVYWVDSTQSAGEVTLSVSFSIGIVSVGASYQPGNAGGVQGQLFTTNIINVPVVCQVSRTYKVKRINVYRYNQYQGLSTAVYYKTIYSAAPYSVRYRYVRV